MSIPISATEAVRVGTKDWCNSSVAAHSTTPITANKDHRQFHDAVEVLQKARNNKRLKIKYSTTCPAFLTIAWINPTSCAGIPGNNNRSTVSMNENVFCEENVPVDIQ
jgi:hypothetical protein